MEPPILCILKYNKEMTWRKTGWAKLQQLTFATGHVLCYMNKGPSRCWLESRKQKRSELLCFWHPAGIAAVLLARHLPH